MRDPHRHREGFALAVSLGAIVVIGALIAGAFWTSMQHYRTTRNSISQERALNAAEYGQNWVLANFSTATAKKMAMGDTVSFAPTVPGGLATVDVRMTRLNMTTYWVVSEGKSGAGTGAVLQSRARTNLILRIDSPNMFVKGAITAAGELSGSGSPDIIGNDVNPAGWGNCPAAGAAKPAVVGDVAADITSAGTCSGYSCFYSDTVKVGTDPQAGLAETYTNYGGLNWDSLTTRAQTYYPSKVYSWGASTTLNHTGVFPSAVGSSCSTTLVTNWGEPLRGTGTVACESYYPIIWIKGSTITTTLEGTARGQGILLVEGNLIMKGQATFAGLVIVKGKFAIEGTGPSNTDGAKVTGAVMLANQDPSITSTVSGNAIVQYSSCALAEVLNQLDPPPIPVASRSWGDMY